MNTTFTTCAEKKAKQFLNLLQGYTKGIRMTAILILLVMGVSNAWGAEQRYIYVGISDKFDAIKTDNQWGFNFWGGTGEGVKSGTWIENITHDGRQYHMFRVQVYDDNNKAQFKVNDSWWEPAGGIDVTLNGTNNNAIFFTHGDDGGWWRWQQDYQVTSSASLKANKTSALVGESVTLTPSLSSNATYNQIKSTTYTVSTNPGSGGSVTSAGVFSATKAGTYTVTATVTYNAKDFTGITKTASATQTIKVYDTQYVLRGSQAATGDPKGGMAGWDATNNNAYTSATINGTTMTIVATLTNAKTQYKFMIYNNFDGSYYGQTGSAEIPNNTSWTLNGSKDVKFTTTAAGPYTFVYNTSTKLIKVQYPAAYTVTYGIHSSGGGNLTATANGAAITSGTYVKENQTIVFTAKPEQGYQVEGWYSDANCTAKLGNGYSISNENNICTIQNLTKTETVYVKFKENTFDVTVTVNNAKGGTTEPSGLQSQIGQVTGMNIAANVNSGYQFIGWDFERGAGAFGAANAASTTFKPSQESTIRANFEPNTYTITYNDLHGVTHSNPPTYTIESETITFTNPISERTGYTFAGWYPTQITKGSTGNQTVSALWTANTYTVTLDQTGAAKEGSTTSVDANFEGNMPAITGDGALPTPQIGYTFMGYFDQKDGKGTQYYNQEGTAFDNKKWDKTKNDTLYAYFQPAKITNITLDKEVFEPISSGEAYVTATPTIDPDDIEGVVVCWRLLYSNGDEVAEHPAIPAGDNKVKFSIVGLATGTYTIEATLHATACGNGEPISTLTKNFIIASEYTVTVKYTCDNQEIKASTTAPAQATETTSITAPDIFGYTFKEWTLGDGVSSESTLTEKTISYTAIYDGTITAKYTKRKLIYFKRPADWGTTIYYYNIGSADKWKESGDGDKGLYTNEINHGAIQMTRIGDSDVYYYDYEATPNTNDDPGLYIAFADAEQNGYTPMWHGCHVSWPIERTRSFNEGTPMFVAANYIHYYWGANYYNAGYWTNYVGETGYTLKIYDKKDGDRKELYSIPFEATTENNIPFKAVVDLEAGKTYGFKFVRANGIWYKNDKDGTMTNDSHTDWPFIWDNENGSACGITTTAAGDYTFTLNLNNATGNLQISVDYPAAVGDYRILYRDNGTTNWSGNPRSNNWCHPSRIIKTKDGANDTISFFINKNKEPQLLYQTIKSINASTGAITWNAATKFEDVKWNVIEKDGVIDFTFTQSKGAIAVTNIELYKGNYYIRVDAVDGKWGNYKTDPDNRMTYSAFSESDANSFGEKFSHYKTQWCPRGTNVKFTIANDYSPCITDTLIRDVTKTWEENMDEHGKLKSDGSQYPTADKYSANIRFMWNRTTNKISRAYLSSATNVTKKFLILQGDDKMKNAEGEEIAATEHVPADATLLQDKENWIYETTIKVQPGARVKLYACYTKTAVEDAQYFRGKTGEFNEENTVQILGGGEGDTWYTMRVIYDFKTNRLLAAWIPDTQIGDEGLQIDADIMIIREHQEEATCINLTEHTNSKLTEVKTVYGVMRFNRWVLNNRANPDDLDIDHCSTVKDNNRQYDEEKVKDFHPVLPLGDQKSIYERSLYFISFPFDVKVSDIFGFGTYWNEWYIEYYDGLKRAREGFFIDSPPNWKYVTPEMADTFKLRAYQGYILGVDLDYMQYDNTSFWAHNIQEIELFFPSTTTMGEICRTEVVMPALGPEYECKINRPNSDHRVIDSYWRCIGVPSYANYDGLLYTDADKKQSITWKTDYTWKGDYSEFPFLYAWNTTDNTITPHSTTTFKFKTMHSYLVQHKDKIHWSAISTKPSSIVAKERNEATRNYEWKITLSRNEKLNDQTFIRMADREDITTEFDFNQDLSKEFNYGRSDIYTLIGNTKAAANSLPITETTTLIPLGLSIEFNGDYTIAMPDRMENIGVTLIDTESNTRTNLSAGMEYVVTLNKGDYNNRFFIEISPAHQVPTDIEYVTGDSNSQDSVRKVLIDNILYIVRDGQIFDARGARVK